MDVLYANALKDKEDVKDFYMEGPGTVTFPLGRMRLESAGRELRDCELAELDALWDEAKRELKARA